MAAAQVLESEESLPAELRPMVEIILRNTGLQARLIDDMLDLTRIVKGKLKLNIERMNVHNVLRNAIEVCRPEVEQKGLALELDLRASATEAEADPGRLEQVFWNILKNAVKFTPRGGRIVVASRNRDGRIAVAVTDSGVGIRPGDLERIFTAFEQAGEEGNQGGLGLGLAVGRALTEQQGGTLDAASDGPGRGATFTVTLPTIGTMSQTAAASGAGPRILLVEDHADTRRVLNLLLTHKGYGVMTASSCRAALDLVGRERFDILLSDLTLPDGSGLDLVREIRTIQNVRAIALSGYSDPDDMIRSREAGFDEHLGKPVDSRRLCAVIDRLARDGQG
jgi:two-component system CheB/CheR fusion protein